MSEIALEIVSQHKPICSDAAAHIVGILRDVPVARAYVQQGSWQCKICFLLAGWESDADSLSFAVLLMIWKIIPAVLTGNTIIIKPSPFTPLCDVRCVELFNRHLPPGVVQIVLGDDNLGPWVTEHPKIRKISFTGKYIEGCKA